MKYLLRSHIVFALAVLVYAQPENASASPPGWPQFLGPDRNAISGETGLARKWAATGPKEIWSIKVGPGFGGASVVGNDVYILDRVDIDREVLRCLDFRSGKETWNYEYATKKVKLPVSGSRSTPTVEGDFIYTLGRLGNVNCVNRRTHKVVWSQDLMKLFDLKDTARWGYSQSPLVVGNHVIVPSVSSESGNLVAFDKGTGRKAWQTGELGGSHYVSPRLYDIAGEKQVLIFGKTKGNRGRFTSVNPATGKTLWTYEGYSNNIMIPSPTNLGDDRLFVTGGYGAGSVMLRVNKSSGRYSVKELYRIDAEGSQIHPAIYFRGQLYANWNTNENLRKGKFQEGGLACIDPDTGKIRWRTGEKPNFDRGNLIFADGMIIILDGELGELALVDPSPGGYHELARAKVFSNLKSRRNMIWAPMALADGKLIVRSQDTLKCLNLRAN